MSGFYTIDEMIEQGWSPQQADDYYTQVLARQGFSMPEIAAYRWSADNEVHQKYSQVRPQMMQQYYADTTRRPGIMRYFQHGYQGSLLGLYSRDKLPDAVSQENLQDANLLQRTAMAIGGFLGDAPGYLPSMLLGAFTGGLGTAAIGGANFAAVDGLKAAMMYDLMHGTHGDPSEKTDEVVKAALQGGIIGTFLPGAKYLGMKGALSSGLAKNAVYREGKNFLGQTYKSLAGAAEGNAWAQAGGLMGETAWMGTAGPLMEGRLPRTQDYVDNLTFMAGMHAMQSAARGAFRRMGLPSGVKKMMDSEVDTGLNAQEQVKLAESNPNYKVELLTPDQWLSQKQKTLGGRLKEKYNRLKAASILYQNEENFEGNISTTGLLSAFMQDVHNDGRIYLEFIPAEDQARVVEMCGTEMIRDNFGNEKTVLKNVEPLRQEMDRLINEYKKPVPLAEQYTPRAESPVEEAKRIRREAEPFANDPGYAAEASRDTTAGPRGNDYLADEQQRMANEYAARADERAAVNRERLSENERRERQAQLQKAAEAIDVMREAHKERKAAAPEPKRELTKEEAAEIRRKIQEDYHKPETTEERNAREEAEAAQAKRISSAAEENARMIVERNRGGISSEGEEAQLKAEQQRKTREEGDKNTVRKISGEPISADVDVKRENITKVKDPGVRALSAEEYDQLLAELRDAAEERAREYSPAGLEAHERAKRQQVNQPEDKGRSIEGHVILTPEEKEAYLRWYEENAGRIEQLSSPEAQAEINRAIVQIMNGERIVPTSSSDETITKVRTPEALESRTMREALIPTGNVDQATEGVAAPSAQQEQIQARRDEIVRQLDESPNVREKTQRTLLLEDLAKPVEDFLVGKGMNKNWARAAGMLEAAGAEHMCKWFGLTPQEYMEQRAPKIVWDRINRRRGPEDQRGSYTPLTDEKGGIIDLFEGFDASTPLHELSHHWFDEIIRAAKINPDGEAMKILRTVASAYGKDVAEIMKMGGEAWGRTQERWAKDYEHWLNTANVRDPALTGVFGQIKVWMKSIYQALKDLWSGTDWKPSAEVQRVFDKLLLGENRGLKTNADKSLYRQALEVLTPEYQQVNVGGRKAGEAGPVYRERDRGITSVGGEQTDRKGTGQEAKSVSESLEEANVRKGALQINLEPNEQEIGGAAEGLYGARTGRTLFQSAAGKGMDESKSKASLVNAMANALGLHVIYKRGRSGSSVDTAQGVVTLNGPQDLRELLTAAGSRVGDLAWGDKKESVLQNTIHDLVKYSGGKGKQTVEKQLGRFVSEFVTDPEKAKAKAPDLYRELDEGLHVNNDELLQVFENTKKVLDSIEAQPGTSRIKNDIVFGKEKKWTFKDLFSRETVDGLYRSIFDESYKVAKIIQGWKSELAGKGLELSADADPLVLMTNLRGTAGLVNHFVEFGTFSFKDRKVNGESYMNIIRDAEKIGDLHDLSAYMTARRGKEMHSRVDKDGNPRRIESGFSDKDIEDTLKEQAKFEEIAQRIDAFEQRVLQYVKDAGLIDDGTLQLIQSLNRAYVPFQRVFMREGGWASGQKAMNAKPIKALKGSTTEIYDPLQTVITNAYVMIHAAERNNVLRSLADLSKMSDNGGLYVLREKNAPQIKQISVDDLNIDEASKNLAKAVMGGEGGQGLLTFFQAGRGPIDKNKIVVWRDGKAEVYRVHDSIGELFNDITPENVGIFTRLLGAPIAKALRKGATLTFDFAARNVFRDTITTSIVSENKFIPVVDTFKGLVHTLKKDATYQAFIRSGGAQSCMVSADRNTAIATMDMLRKTGFMDKVWNVVKDPLEALAKVSEISENATRVGEFAKTFRADLDPDRATLMKAGYNARTILDYSRQGRDVKGLSAVVAFFNPNLQGVDKMFRSAISDPMRFAARAALYVAAPSVLLAMRNYGDEDINEIPKSQRDLFWMAKVGEGDSKVILRIPKPFEAGVLFGSTLERTVEFCMDVMNDKNGGDVEKTREQAFRGLGASIWANLHPSIVPTAVTPFLEHWANKSTYTGLPIVPAYLEGIVPEEQATEHNTQLMRWLSQTMGHLPGVGDMLKFSPAVAENYVRGWSGGLGTYALQALDFAGRQLGVLPNDAGISKGLEDIPFVRAFVMRHPSMSAESIVSFYENYREAAQNLQTLNFARRTGDPKLLQEYMPAAVYSGIEKTKAALGNVSKAVREVYHMPGMTPEEKRKMIESLYWQAIQTAKYGNMQFYEARDLFNEQREQAMLMQAQYPSLREPAQF